MTAMGAVTNWRQLTALRAILGAFEATLFPGAAYLIACWYPRKQMALRNAVFYVMSIVVSGLSAILAWGISQLNGRTGRAGWRWIFIIQGESELLLHSVNHSGCGPPRLAITPLSIFANIQASSPSPSVFSDTS